MDAFAKKHPFLYFRKAELQFSFAALLNNHGGK